MKNQLLKSLVVALLVSNSAFAYESAMTQEEIEKARAEQKANLQEKENANLASMPTQEELKKAQDDYNNFVKGLNEGSNGVNMPTTDEIEKAKSDFANFQNQLNNGEIDTSSFQGMLDTSNKNKDDELTGDTKLACEAILCLSSETRPSECNPSLRKYFSIHAKKLTKL